MSYTLLNGTIGAAEFIRVIPQLGLPQAFLTGKWTKIVHALGITAYSALVTTYVLTQTQMDEVYDLAVGGSDTPLIRDFAKNGTVITSLKGRKHPTFSDGKQISYVNHIVKSDGLCLLFL